MQNARTITMMTSGSRPAYWGLCFTAEEANVVVNMAATGNSSVPITLKSSIDGVNWAIFDTDTGTTPVTLSNVGDKVYFKAGELGNEQLSYSSSAFRYFTFSGRISASGNIMSLLDGDNSLNTVISGSYAFPGLFYNCTALTAAPALPATTLAKYCYANMFRGCTSLASAPALPATTLAASCYRYMFYGCTSLVTTPDLPVTSSTNSYIYQQMFYQCTSLERTGKIAISTATGTNALAQMFYGCSNLKYIELTGMTAWSTRMANWVSGVATSGTFKCPAALGTNDTITRGVSNCPEGWTVVNI